MRKVMKKDFIVKRSITMIEGKPHVETYSEQELVRCKDCRRYYANGGNCDQVLADWFCADGQRSD